MTIILAIETSRRPAQVGLFRDGVPIGRPGGRPAEQPPRASSLVADVFALLQSAAVDPRQCEAVAVSLGPGSFTGLRAGVVFAKTFAYATGCRVVGVETFAAIADNAAADVSRQIVVEDAQRNGLFAGCYERRDHGWERKGPLEVLTVKELAQRLEGWPAPLSGPALGRFPPLLEHDHLPESCWYPRVERIAEIAERSLAAGRSDDPWKLIPIYGRRSAAEEKRDQTAAESSRENC